MGCGVGRRRDSDLALLWLCCRLAATTPIRLLAWEPPYAAGAALKIQNDKKKKQKDSKHIKQELRERNQLEMLPFLSHYLKEQLNTHTHKIKSERI